MRRWTPLLLLLATGCSNAPLAGFLDLVHPSKIGRPASDPLGPAELVPPPGAQFPPPPGAVNPPPITSPPPVNSGFMPPLSPRDPSPLPPPEPSGPSPRVGPLNLPNT